MRQNKEIKLVPWGAIALFLLLTVVLCWGLFPGFNAENFSWDARFTYSRNIEESFVTTWHSELFIYECILLRFLLILLTGAEVSGIGVLCCAWWCGFSALMCALSFVIWRLVRLNYVYALITIPFSFAVKWTIEDTPCGLDFFFLVALSVLLVLILVEHGMIGKIGRVLMMVAILFVLWHVCAYRKNAAVIVPFVLAPYCWRLGCCRAWLWKLSLPFLATILFMVITVPFVSTILPVVRLHPVIPMMESDERISCILRGDYDTYPRVFRNHDEAAKQTIAASAGGHLIRGTYSQMYKGYVRLWMDQPYSMAVARLVQIVQFYNGGHTPVMVRSWVHSHFPAVVKSPETWKTFEFSVVDKTWVCGRGCILLLGLFFASYKLFKWRKMRAAEKYGVFCISAALLYSFSFVICTPTPDARYLSASVMVVFMVLSVFAVRFISHKMGMGAFSEENQPMDT